MERGGRAAIKGKVSRRKAVDASNVEEEAGSSVRPQVFPNEATAFHPWLPLRSRRARLCAWAARKLPSGAAWRMQMAGVAWNSRTQWTFALRPGRGYNPVDIALPVQPFERMSNRGQNLPEYVFLQ